MFVAHEAALLIAGFIGSIGMADGCAFARARALAMYALPKGFWIFLDLYRHRSGKPEVTGSRASAGNRNTSTYLS